MNAVLTYGGRDAYTSVPVELPYDIIQFIEELEEVDRILLNDIIVRTLRNTRSNIETWRQMALSEPVPDVY